MLENAGKLFSKCLTSNATSCHTGYTASVLMMEHVLCRYVQVKVHMWATQPALAAALNSKFRDDRSPADEGNLYPMVLVRTSEEACAVGALVSWPITPDIPSGFVRPATACDAVLVVPKYRTPG